LRQFFEFKNKINISMIKNNVFIIFMLCLPLFCANVLAQTDIEDDTRVNQYGQRVRSFPLRSEAQNNVLVFQNSDRDFKFWFDNRVQIDAAHYFGLMNGMPVGGNAYRGSTAEPKMTGGVSLRRVRFAVKAEVGNGWYGEVDMNLANGNFVLQDAIIEYSGFKNIDITIGNFKDDFSMEYTTSSRYLTMMERSMVIAAFNLSRRLGVQVQWLPKDYFRTSIGVSWQEVGDGDQRYNVEELNKEGHGIGPSVTWKGVWMPWGGQPDYGLHIGYNVMYRDARQPDDRRIDYDIYDPRAYGGIYLSARNSTFVNRTKFISNEFYGVKHSVLQGFELAGYKDGFRISSELITMHTVMDTKKIDEIRAWLASDPQPLPPPLPGEGKRWISRMPSTTDTKFFYGFHVQATYLLFGGKQRYDITQSEFTQPVRGKSWGDVEIKFRYDYLDLNNRVKPFDRSSAFADVDMYGFANDNVRGGSGQNFTFEISYHTSGNVKFSVNFQHSQNDVYASNRGRAYIGRNEDGDYTRNPDYAVTDRGVRFSALQTRLEIAF
jgi:phosphate-selective porin OprO/OprP